MSITTNSKISATASATQVQKEVAAADVSAWISASAGSGKTKVLVDRVLNLLLADNDVRKIWCITYTNAGASEMVGRINKKLKDFSAMTDGELAAELQKLGHAPQEEDFDRLCRQARSLFAKVVDNNGGVRITTIHGLCQWILKRFPLESGLSPYFSVLEEDDAKEMLSSITDAVLRDAYEKNEDSSFAILIKDISGKMKKELFECLFQRKIKLLEAFEKAGGSFEAFINSYYQKLGIVRGESFISVLKENDFAGLCGRMREELLAKLPKNTSGEKTAVEKVVEKVIEAASDYLNAETDDDLLSAFNDIKGLILTKEDKLNRKKINVEKYPFMENYAAVVSEFKNRSVWQKYILENEALLKVGIEIVQRYQDEKRKRMLLDFDDLIMATERLLKNAEDRHWVLYRLDNGLDHLLLDEAQDTSPEQWRIIRCLCEEFFAGGDDRKRTLFVVGDKKQSIYSFQGARPEMFDEMRRYFAERVKTSASSTFKEKSMAVSFRSSQGILTFINYFLFDQKASQGVVGKDEENVEHLTADCNKGKGAVVELWPLNVKTKGGDKNNAFSPERQTTVSNKELAKNTAKKIAMQIRALLDGKADDAKRVFQPSDIMILLRSRNNSNLINSIVKYCKEMGVPIIGADKFKLKADIVVADLLSLGKFLLSPYDDLSLAEVLRSPLIKSSLVGANAEYADKDDYLYALCTGRGDSRLFDALKEKDPEVFAVINDWLGKALYHNPYDLYAMILDGDYGGRRRYISAMGKAVDDILKEFLYRVLTFEREHPPTLYAFVDWLSKTDVFVKRENSENAVKALNAVRIMTVHAAKGLQSEIVVIPDAGRECSLDKEHILSDDEMFFINKGEKFPYPRVVAGIRETVWEKMKEEYHRLLYVALSRAKTAVYIASADDKEKNDSWYGDLLRIMKDRAISEVRNNITGDMVFRLNDGLINDDIAAPKEPDNVIAADGTLFLTDDLRYRADDAAIPSYLAAFPEAEAEPSKPLRPSRPEDENGGFSMADKECFRRGSLIHKLLEIMPDEAAAVACLRREGYFLDDSERERIMANVKEICRQFPVLFGPSSFAEVPVIAMVDGEKGKREISGQIDRLAVVGDTVMIVDFKTNRNGVPAQLAAEYRRQLAMYAVAVSGIYPDKTVKKYILWTERLEMDEIE